ncbi:MAG: hypothetical protein GFH24_608434n12 [Chloroflexi bacterium AL-N5]|nr:hypothetical protein [Chloroflexi bacterium AL-N5]
MRLMLKLALGLLIVVRFGLTYAQDEQADDLIYMIPYLTFPTEEWIFMHPLETKPFQMDDLGWYRITKNLHSTDSHGIPALLMEERFYEDLNLARWVVRSPPSGHFAALEGVVEMRVRLYQNDKLVQISRYRIDGDLLNVNVIFASGSYDVEAIEDVFGHKMPKEP